MKYVPEEHNNKFPNIHQRPWLLIAVLVPELVLHTESSARVYLSRWRRREEGGGGRPNVVDRLGRRKASKPPQPSIIMAGFIHEQCTISEMSQENGFQLMF